MGVSVRECARAAGGCCVVVEERGRRRGGEPFALLHTTKEHCDVLVLLIIDCLCEGM